MSSSHGFSGNGAAVEGSGILIDVSTLLQTEWRVSQFQAQQKFFTVKAATKTNECTVTSNNAVTGNYYRQRILAVGCSNRSACFRFSNAFGDITIAACRAVGNFLQRGPDR
jgi:hypothetical protein